jgi:hypothetical protein
MENEIIFHVVREPFSLKARRLFGRTLTWFIPFRKVRHRVRDFISNYQIFKVINKYDCIFSAGEACHVAGLLKEMGLRKFSGPFDWMYGGDPITRLNLIADEFANYLNKEDLVLCEKSSSTEHKCIYSNKRTGLVYNHDFFSDDNFDRDYLAMREKYDRRIARVVNKMKSGEKTLIIYVNIKTESGKMAKKEDIERAVLRINEVYGDNVDVLFIVHNDDMQPGYVKLAPKRNHLYYGKHTGFKWNDNTTNPKGMLALRQVVKYMIEN